MTICMRKSYSFGFQFMSLFYDILQCEISVISNDPLLEEYETCSCFYTPV